MKFKLGSKVQFYCDSCQEPYDGEIVAYSSTAIIDNYLIITESDHFHQFDKFKLSCIKNGNYQYNYHINSYIGKYFVHRSEKEIFPLKDKQIYKNQEENQEEAFPKFGVSNSIAKNLLDKQVEKVMKYKYRTVLLFSSESRDNLNSILNDGERIISITAPYYVGSSGYYHLVVIESQELVNKEEKVEPMKWDWCEE